MCAGGGMAPAIIIESRTSTGVGRLSGRMTAMPIEGEYEPSTWGWVADQVER